MKACLHCCLRGIVVSWVHGHRNESKDLKDIFSILAPAFQADPGIMESCFRLDNRAVAISVCMFSSSVDRIIDTFLFDAQFGGRFARLFCAVPDTILGNQEATSTMARRFRWALNELGFVSSHELIERWTRHTPRRTRRKHLRQARAYHAYHGLGEPSAFAEM